MSTCVLWEVGCAGLKGSCPTHQYQHQQPCSLQETDCTVEGEHWVHTGPGVCWDLRYQQPQAL